MAREAFWKSYREEQYGRFTTNKLFPYALRVSI